MQIASRPTLPEPGRRAAGLALVPPEKVRATVHGKPTACRRRGHGPSGNDPEPLIPQVADRPTIEPVVDESRLHRWTCPGRGETTCGVLPPGVPTGGFGPELRAMLALLAGADRLGKRPISQWGADRFGLSISTGRIAQRKPRSAAALEAPDHKLATAVPQAAVVHIDETSWREDRRNAWSGATVARCFTGFTIAKHRRGAIAQALLGRRDGPVVGGDRFGASDWVLACWRPVCWARPRRDFQALMDRGGDRETIGRRLLSLSNRWFRHGHRARDGTREGRVLQERMGRLRREVKQALRDGSRCACVPTAAPCFEVLKVEDGPWTFTHVPGVEPTNNPDGLLEDLTGVTASHRSKRCGRLEREGRFVSADQEEGPRAANLEQERPDAEVAVPDPEWTGFDGHDPVGQGGHRSLQEPADLARGRLLVLLGGPPGGRARSPRRSSRPSRRGPC
jgi:transposase